MSLMALPLVLYVFRQMSLVSLPANMLDVVNMLSRVPHAFQQNKYLSAVDMAACYVIIIGGLRFAYWSRVRRLRNDFTSVEKHRIA